MKRERGERVQAPAEGERECVCERQSEREGGREAGQYGNKKGTLAGGAIDRALGSSGRQERAREAWSGWR